MTLVSPRKRFGAIAVAAALTALLAGCNGAAASPPTTEAPNGVELPRISTIASYPALPSGLEQGLFDDAFGTDASGMTVDYIASAPDAVQALVAGHSDIVIAGYDPGVLSHEDLRILALTEISPDTHAVLVPPGSEIQSIADLEGTTVGGVTTTLPLFLQLMLHQEGLDDDFFEYIQVPNDGGLSALNSGAIDAWYTWDPFFAEAELQDLAEPIVTGGDFYLNPIVLQTTQTYLDEHPDEVSAFIEGYIDATAWVNEHPDAAGDYMANATGMTPDAAEITIERRSYEVVVPDESAIEWMELSNELQRATGLITHNADLEELIDTALVEQALANKES